MASRLQSNALVCRGVELGSFAKIMKPRGSAKAFRLFAESQAVRLADATPTQGVDLMLRFYCAVHADCRLLSDALIYEWGIYQDDTDFTLSIHRLFAEQIFEKEADEDGEEVLKEVRQSILSFAFYFPASQQLMALGNKNHGCDCTEDVPNFERRILKSKAFRMLGQSTPLRLALSWKRL
jgi:hypothetical protein